MPSTLPHTPTNRTMPFTARDPLAALVVTDIQRSMTSNPTVHPIAAVIGNAAWLA